MKHSYILLTLLVFMCLITGCGSTNADAAGTSTEQTDEIDDLSATLEEAVLTLTGDVSDTISRVDTLAVPAGSVEEQREQFLNLKQEISEMDRRIDDLDDTIERNYRNSQITPEEYQKFAGELESLEELMDSTEDKLEFTYKMED